MDYSGLSVVGQRVFILLGVIIYHSLSKYIVTAKYMYCCIITFKSLESFQYFTTKIVNNSGFMTYDIVLRMYYMSKYTCIMT